MNQKNKDKALETAVSQIEKQFGKGSLMKLGDDSVDQSIEAIGTGSIGLDAALGIGGLPKGRVVEIYGPESSGKTTLTLQVVAECQKAGGTAAFIDAEHALDPIYAEKIGVNTEEFFPSTTMLVPELGTEKISLWPKSIACQCSVRLNIACSSSNFE